MRYSFFLLISLLAIVALGCSGGSPVSTDLSGTEIQPTDKSAALENHHVWGVYDITYDQPSKLFKFIPSRQSMVHVGMDELIGGTPVGDFITIDFRGIDRQNRILSFDLTLTNPFPNLTARDVRGIISGDHPGYYLLNGDGAFDLIDDTPNTFIAFAKDEPNREFAGGISHTEKCEMHFPPDADFKALRLTIDATYPGNCREPYAFSEFSFEDEMLSIGVLDWQDNIDSVSILATSIGGNVDITLERDDARGLWYASLFEPPGGGYRLVNAEFIGRLTSSDDHLADMIGGFASTTNNINLPGTADAVPGFSPASPLLDSSTGNTIRRLCFVRADSDGGSLYGLLRLEIEPLPEDLINEIAGALKMSLELQDQFYDPRLRDDDINIVAFITDTPLGIYANIKNDADAAFPEISELAEEIKTRYRAAQPEISAFADKYYEEFKANEDWAVAEYNAILNRHQAGKNFIGNMVRDIEKLRERRASYVTDMLEANIAPLQEPAIFQLNGIEDTTIMLRDYVVNVLYIQTKVKRLGEIASLDTIEYIEPDFELTLLMNVAHQAVNAPSMWGAGYTGGTFDVMVYDTGIDSSHPALTSHFYALDQERAFGGACTYDDTDWGVFAGHGTHCAGIVASTDATYRGTGYGLDKIFNGKHCTTGGWSAVVQAVQWAGLGGTHADPAETISFSWAWGPGVGCVRDGSAVTSRYVDETTYLNGQLWSVAAGNRPSGICSDDGIITMPSDGFNVFSVANINDLNSVSRANDIIAGSSRYGPAIAPGGETRIKPDITAPGSSIVSCNTYWESQADFVSKTGTSMAAPNVAGASALVMDAGLVSSLEVRAMIHNSAEDWNSNLAGPGSDGPDIYTGYGYLDLTNALLNLGNIVADNIATSNIRFYRHSTPAANDSVMVIWDRYVSGLTAFYPDIDLEMYDDTTNMMIGLDDKTYDNRRFLLTGTTNDVVYKIEAKSIPAVSPTWDYVITASGGTLSTEIFPGSIDPVINHMNPAPVGIEFDITATVTNNGDFVLRNIQGTLNLDTNMSFQSGSVATESGAAILLPGNNTIITWHVTVDVYSATPKNISIDTAATAYGEVFSGTANSSINVIVPDPILEVAPLTLDFGDSLPQLAFEISNVGYNTLTWTIDDSVFPGWLSIDNNGDTTSAEIDTVNVFVDRTGMATGIYFYDIPVNSDYGNKIVHIDMEVPPPMLYVDPNLLDFGGVAVQMSFDIQNIGGGTLIWTIDDSAFPGWLSIDHNTDTTQSETDIVLVDIDRTALAYGDYSHIIDVASDGGADTVQIDMTVPDPTVPLLDVFPNSLNFLDPTVTLPFDIQNAGGGTLNWSIDDSGFPVWLNIDNFGDSCSTEVDTVNVIVDRTGLSLTAYSHDILVVSDAGNDTVHVDLEVLDPTIAVLEIAEYNLYYGTIVTQKNVVITNAGIGVLTWELLHTGDYEFPSWLSANIYAGIVDELHPQGGCIIYVDRTGLAPGPYTHDLHFTSNGGDAIVHVFMSVAMPTPELSINLTLLDFGTDEKVKQFIVSNIGEPGSILNWSMPLAGKPDWVNASTYSGSIATNQVSAVQVVVDRTDLVNVGGYSHIFNVTSNGGNEDVLVKLTVPDIDPLAPVLISPLDGHTYEVTTWLALAWDGDPGYDGKYWLYSKFNGVEFGPFSDLSVNTNSISLPPQVIDKLAKYGTWEWQISIIETPVPMTKHYSDWWTIYKPRPELVTPPNNSVVSDSTQFTWNLVPTANPAMTIYVAKVTGFAPIDPLYYWWGETDTAVLPPAWYDILLNLGESNTYTWTVAAVCPPAGGMTLQYAEKVRYPAAWTFHLE